MKKQNKSSVMVKAGKKAWEKRIVNQIANSNFKLSKIKNYLTRRPETSELVKTILLNLNLSIQFENKKVIIRLAGCL